MNRFRPPPALRLCRGHACVIQPHLIEEVTVAIRTSSPCCCWDRIDDGGEIALARPQSIFGFFPIIDIGAGSVPSLDLARLVAERLGTNQKPTINAIMATKTRLDFIR